MNIRYKVSEKPNATGDDRAPSEKTIIICRHSIFFSFIIFLLIIFLCPKMIFAVKDKDKDKDEHKDKDNDKD